jgi:hypothetical protein
VGMLNVARYSPYIVMKSSPDLNLPAQHAVPLVPAVITGILILLFLLSNIYVMVGCFS